MTDKPTFPQDEQDDRNEDLLRRIQEALDEGSVAGAHPAPGDAPFFDALLGMRRHVDAGTDSSSDDAARRIWARIEEATSEDQATSVRPIRLRRPLKTGDRALRRPADHPGTHAPALRPVRLAWFAAAAVVLLAAVVTLMMLATPEPVLVASAGETSIEYTTEDGSVVILRAHSDLYRIEAGEDEARFRLTGEAFFDVTTRTAGLFSVEAGDAVIEVLGTRFNVGTWSGETTVYLEEGRIRFVHASGGQDVILAPGQSSRTEGERLLPPVGAAPAAYTDWLRNELEFDQQPVHLIARELEQQYDIVIDVPDSIASQTLSGRLLLGDVDTSLRDLALALGGRFVPSGSGSHRFETR